MENKPSDIHTLIRDRWSSRIMDPERAVHPGMIDLLLEAARWAPSSSNLQPWRYLVFDDRIPEARDAARSLLVPANHAWASRAPVLLVAVAQEIQDNGKVNNKALHDLGLANENLLLQAIALGLNCRPMAGFNHKKAQTIFNIPEGYRAIAMIAIGHPGKLEDFPEEVQAKEALERKRHPVCDFAYHGGWGEVYSPSTD